MIIIILYIHTPHTRGNKERGGREETTKGIKKVKAVLGHTVHSQCRVKGERDRNGWGEKRKNENMNF